MIIVRLYGGLGNQMFQYATAKRLASKHQVELKLDVESFSNDSLRNFELYNLSISGTVMSQEEALKSRGNRLRGPLRLLAKLRNRTKKKFGRPSIYRERHFHFDPAVLDLPENVCFDGYWQTEKYFLDIYEQIRDEFKPRSQLSSKVIDLVQQMKEVNSVSIHVRRGDYVRNSRTNRYHGVCGVDYYQRCLDDLANRIHSPSSIQLFVFSDDIDWAKHNLNFTYPVTYVSDAQAIRDYEELYLMSSCKHNIIANSTFSWWGAWLNPHNEKIVYAPNQWFANRNGRSTDDLIPSDWNRL